MKKTRKTFLLATLAAAAFTLSACTGKTATGSQETDTTDSLSSEELIEQEIRSTAAEGELAPDFTLTDFNGQPLTLSSLRGKVVVLDFWGSWCGWCIKGFPEMKAYYQKYAGKFEILGLDAGDIPEDWKKAVKEHSLPWLHVQIPEDSKLLETYGIQGFPTKMVLDADGKILKIVVGEDPAFYTYLDELFGK